jgi:predicted permease
LTTHILRDAAFAIRNLTRSLGFTAVVILTLALGIGASTAIFTVVNAVVLRPLDYPDPQQLVRITSELRGFGATDTGVSAPELGDYQSRADLFTGVAGTQPINANVTSGDAPERVEMMLVSWNYFAVLGVAPAHGRLFAREDDTPGVANIAIVSDAFWRRTLGGDPAAIGRTITIDEDPIVVVGVMPPAFRHPGRTLQNDVDVWSPAGFGGTNNQRLRGRRRLEGCLARLQAGVTLEQAQTRLADHGAIVSRQFPSDYPDRYGWRPRVVSLQDDVVGAVSTTMFVLLTGVGLLLLVACVNVTHLVLARSSARRQEMAIRQALGATPGRLISQLVTESAIVAAAGGTLAVLVASWGLRALVALAPGRIPRLDTVSLDVTAIVVTGVISLAVTLVIGLVPAVQTRRVETAAALTESGRSSSGRSTRTRDLLVAAEIAMATVLLVCAGLFVRSVIGLLNVPVGFETDRLMTARITLPRPNDPARAAYLDPARRAAFAREAVRRVAALPGVEAAAMSTQIPLGGFNAPLLVDVEGLDATAAGARPVMHTFQVSPSYFETLGVKILSGRPFADSDRAGTDPVVIVGETAARMFWRDRDPIGGRIRLAPDAPWITVVGVAGDVLNRRLSEPPQPMMYLPLEQSSDMSLALLVRARADIAGLGRDITREIRAVDPSLPVYAVRTMPELIANLVSQRRFLMRLLLVFGTTAAALALLGIYGVMAYSVSQRTREIGIRMAIGARQIDVSRMVMRHGMALTASGVVVGIGASLGLSQIARSQLFGVQPSDPLTLASVLTLMTLVAAFAAYLPARRAARVDPVQALRN